MSWTYPTAPVSDETIESNGHVIADPYRWLEDVDSTQTRAWVTAQQLLTDSFLRAAPAREEIRSRLAQLWNFPTRSAPARRGKRWFQWRNTGLQNQPVLYVMSSPADEGRVLLDPNTLTAEGTAAVTGHSFTKDGTLLCYAISDAGADWMTWRVRDVETGADLPDVVEWSKAAGGEWAGDSGFYYSSYERPNSGNELVAQTGVMRVQFHRLGTDPAEDPIVFCRPDLPGAMPIAQVTDDGRFVVVTLVTAGATETMTYVQSLDSDRPQWHHLAGDLQSYGMVIGTEGDDFYVLTNVGAPRRRIVRLRPGDPVEAWREAVPQGEHMLNQAWHVGGHLVCLYLNHATAELTVTSREGQQLHQIELPDCSTVVGVNGSFDDPLMFFQTTSFTDPGTVWSHDVPTGVTELIDRSEAPLSDQELVTEQVFVDSVDGTKVPAFLVHRADITPTGHVPVLLTGYGGFNIPRTPAFAVPNLVWVERGGLLVVGNLRGGGEYGAGWHDAGRLANKQNVFDDFSSIAGWLHTSGWSEPAKIGIHGGSNGGLLVGACLTQHPELFGAAVPEVGVLDMLRFHKFTVGSVWASEYGDPDDEQAFEWLARYSPVHNVRAGLAYPPTLVMTADHDDRVVPGHSFKFGAALQAAQAGGEPVLVRIETAAGHGQGKPITKLIDARADMLAFLDLALATAT